MKKKTADFFDYLILITGSVFFLLFLKGFQGEKLISFFVLATFVSFYVIWGIFHHLRDKSLHLKNVIEYILFGFCILLLLTVLFSF